MVTILYITYNFINTTILKILEILLILEIKVSWNNFYEINHKTQVFYEPEYILFYIEYDMAMQKNTTKIENKTQITVTQMYDEPQEIWFAPPVYFEH